MSNPSETAATKPAPEKKLTVQQKPDQRPRTPASAVIIVGNATYVLPRNLLCENSPVIKNVISKKAHGTPRVHINGIDEKTFDVVLSFMRKGETDLDVQNVIDVYHTAHSLQMKQLELKCWSHVFDKPPYERSLPAWIWGKKMGLKKETDQLFDFIVRNFDDIAQTESFLELNNQQVKEIIQSDVIKADNELALYKAAMKWVHYDCKDRQKETKDVMTAVRFQDMTPEQLASLRQFKICPEVQKSFDIDARLAEIGQQKAEKKRNYGSQPPKPPSPPAPAAPPTAPKSPQKPPEKPAEKRVEKPPEKPPEQPAPKEPPLPFSEASKVPAFLSPKRAEEKSDGKKLEPKVSETKKEERRDDKKDRDGKDKDDKDKDFKKLEKDKLLKDKGDMKVKGKKDRERKDRKDKKDKKDKNGKPGTEVSKMSTSLSLSEMAKTPATPTPAPSEPSVTSGPTSVSSMPPSIDSKPEKKGKKQGEKEGKKDKKHKKHETKPEKKKKGLCPWMTGSGKSSKSKSKESSKKGSKEAKKKGDKKKEKHKKKKGKSGSKESLKEGKGSEGTKVEKEKHGKKGASSKESTSSKSKSGDKRKHKKDKGKDKAKKDKGSKEKTTSRGTKSKSRSKEKSKSDTMKSKKASRSASPTGSSSKSSKTSPAPSRIATSPEARDVAISKGSVTAVHRGRGKPHSANRISRVSSESSLLGRPTFKQERRKRNHSNVPHRALSVMLQTPGNTSHSLELGSSPYPTEELAVITLGGLAVDSKGMTTESSDVYSYNSKDNKWFSVGKLPSPRYGHQAVVLQTYIYIVGGFEVTSGKCHIPTAACYRYSLVKKAWDTAPSLKNRRCHHGAAVVAGRIYAVGGQSAEALFMDSVESYDPELNNWSSVTPLCCARMAANAIELNSQMYVVGGLMVVPGHKRKVCIVPDTMCFNPEMETWHHKAGLPVPMCNSSLVVHKGRLLAFGGLVRNISQKFNQPLAPLGDVLEYTPSRDNWVQISTMPTLSHNVCVASMGDDIYVLGGQLEDDAVTATKLSYRFNPTTGRWVTLPSLPLRLSQAGSVVVHKDIFT